MNNENTITIETTHNREVAIHYGLNAEHLYISGQINRVMDNYYVTRFGGVMYVDNEKKGLVNNDVVCNIDNYFFCDIAKILKKLLETKTVTLETTLTDDVCGETFTVREIIEHVEYEKHCEEETN